MSDTEQDPIAKAALAEHHKEVNAIIELGRGEFGRDQFDQDSQVVAQKLGNRTQEAMALLRQFDAPHRLIKHFADNESALDAFSKMNTARQITELARIEARSSSYGHVRTGADPAWKTPAGRGRMSNEDWNATGGDALSDAEWHREYDRRQAQRRRRR
jgi:hypothetical protein